MPECTLENSVRELCRPYNSVRELFQIIASQNATSSHSCFHLQQATCYPTNSPSLSELTVHLDPTIQRATCYHLNSPSLSKQAGHLDRPLCSIFSFNAHFIRIVVQAGQSSIFYCYIPHFLAASPVDAGWTDAWPTFGPAPTWRLRGVKLFYLQRFYSFLSAWAPHGEDHLLTRVWFIIGPEEIVTCLVCDVSKPLTVMQPQTAFRQPQMPEPPNIWFGLTWNQIWLSARFDYFGLMECTGRSDICADELELRNRL